MTNRNHLIWCATIATIVTWVTIGAGMYLRGTP